MYIGLPVKYLLLSDFNETIIFSTDFRKILISIFMKIHPVGAEFYGDGWSAELIVCFRNFADDPNEFALNIFTYKYTY